MCKIPKILLLTILLLMLAPSIYAEKIQAEEAIRGYELLLKGRDMLFSEDHPSEEIAEIWEESKSIFSRLPEGVEKYYYLAEVDYFYGLTVSDSSPKISEEKFTASQKMVLKALQYKEFSDGYRLLADTYIQLMSYKGFFYQALHGAKLKSLPKKALSLDGENHRARISLALFYLNAPSFAGGSLEKGINSLEAALSSSDGFDLFLAHAWLAVAYQRKGDPSKAERHQEEALAIYPHNSWAQNLLAKEGEGNERTGSQS